jgi:hypothetical protein
MKKVYFFGLLTTLGKLELTPREKEELIAFLRSLDRGGIAIEGLGGGRISFVG